ncbi:hypothetical protein DCC85_01290 [Paenibacillus sp. CAA11]|uniref:ABC transporter ATP-binding protein n=1 Tax=Paenibacillus sp. CAA11 TaxID=1532905 RepID=UPI000D362BC9|nr:ABC transporter ATP-binding protein [Paenibacillus sp. CAA11]AWB42998.1 hypothetical protein DCC85_01290 [Paenibacillus sp. CAA11]
MDKNYLVRHVWEHKTKLIVCFILLVMITLLSIVPGILTKNIFDKGIMVENFRYIFISVVMLCATYILNGALTYISNNLNIKVTQNVLSEIYKELLVKILKMPMDFFKDKESGYILSRLNEVNQLSSILSLTVLQSVIGVFQFLGVYTILIITDYKITLLFTVIIPLFIIVPKYCNSKLTGYSKNVFEKNSVLQGKVVQAIKGVEEIKTLSLEEDKSKELSEIVTGLKTFQIKQANVFSISSVFSSGLNNIVSVLILLVCGYFVVFHHLSLGTYMMFSMYIPILCGSIQSITTVFVHLKPTMISFKRIETFFYEVEEEEMNCKLPIDEIRTITIENLNFKYANHPNLIIEDLNLTIEANDKILITGKNGSGKTTLLRLLLGLYRVDDGRILVNGMNINDITRDSLRNRISTVSQKIHLFNDSIKNNIICHYDVDPQQYSKILDAVNLADFIQTLELKDDTLVGENGVNLSGGQIQKIAIARALIRNADVFLFDEFLSNVDDESKSIIEVLLQDMLKDKICIFIEHQPLFDSICNKLVNMEKANYSLVQ